MKTTTAPLTTLLNSGKFVYCDLYTITLLGGTVLRYADHDQPITFNGNTFIIGPNLKRSRTKTKIGVTTDTMEVQVSAPTSVTIAGTPMIAFIAAGGLDGARWRVERIFAADWATVPTGTLLMFGGRQGDTSMGRHEASVTVKSDLELLDAQVPKNLWTPGCANTLYDSACGQSRAGRTVTGTTVGLSGSPKTQFASGLAQATGYFDLGVVTITSGLNTGQVRTIKYHQSGGGTVVVIAPFPFPVLAGTTFNIYPGCDKTQATCLAKFANLIRFRGKPYVPVPETVT